MILYSDKGLTNKIDDIDFGIVLAGDTKKIELYLLNDSSAEVVDIKPFLENSEASEIKILSFPEKLSANQSGKIELSWTPSVTLKKGLKTAINFNFYELYGG